MIRVIYVADNAGLFSESVSEYQKRLGTLIEVIRIKPVKNTEVAVMVREETGKIVECLKKIKGKIFLLDEYGDESTTVDFAKKLRIYLDGGDDVTFLIGGAFWVDRDVLAPYIFSRIGISKFTLPHSLALAILLEQIYRSNEIWKGSKYHHA